MLSDDTYTTWGACEWCEVREAVLTVAVDTVHGRSAASLCDECAKDVVVNHRELFDRASHQRPQQ